MVKPTRKVEVKWTCKGSDGSGCGRKHKSQTVARKCIKHFKKEGDWEIVEVGADEDLDAVKVDSKSTPEPTPEPTSEPVKKSIPARVAIEYYQKLNFDFSRHFIEDGIEVSFFCGSRGVKVSTDSSDINPIEWIVWISAGHLDNLTNDWKWTNIKTGITKDEPGKRKVLLRDRWVAQEDIRCIRYQGRPVIAIRVRKGLGRLQTIQARNESDMASWLAWKDKNLEEKVERDWSKPLDLTPRCENCGVKMTKKHAKHHEFCDGCYTDVTMDYVKSQGHWLRDRYEREVVEHDSA
jgi:hypothetical protein